MKNTIYGLVIIIFMAFTHAGFSQTPPPPNGNGSNPNSGGNTPVGGGAPVGSGLAVLLALVAIYGSKKVFDLNKIDNE